LTDAIGVAPSKVLSDHRSNGEAERHDRQKECLHHSCSDPESGLGGRSKASNDAVNNYDINEEQNKLRAGRHSDAKHRPPDFHLRPEKLKTEAQVVLFSLEINHHQDIRDQDGNESRERRAAHSQLGPRSDPENQQRRKHDVEQDAEHLESDGWLNNSRRSQRRSQRDQWKLKQKRGNKPKQITFR